MRSDRSRIALHGLGRRCQVSARGDLARWPRTNSIPNTSKRSRPWSLANNSPPRSTHGLDCSLAVRLPVIHVFPFAESAGEQASERARSRFRLTPWSIRGTQDAASRGRLRCAANETGHHARRVKRLTAQLFRNIYRRGRLQASGYPSPKIDDSSIIARTSDDAGACSRCRSSMRC
jgi:hypothetical protein